MASSVSPLASRSLNSPVLARRASSLSAANFGSKALILATRASICLTLRSLEEPKTFLRSSMRGAGSGLSSRILEGGAHGPGQNPSPARNSALHKGVRDLSSDPLEVNERALRRGGGAAPMQLLRGHAVDHAGQGLQRLDVGGEGDTPGLGERGPGALAPAQRRLAQVDVAGLGQEGEVLRSE